MVSLLCREMGPLQFSCRPQPGFKTTPVSWTISGDFVLSGPTVLCRYTNKDCKSGTNTELPKLSVGIYHCRQMQSCVALQPFPQTVRSDKYLDPIAAKLLYPRETAVYTGSRKGRQVTQTSGVLFQRSHASNSLTSQVVVTKMRQLAFDAKLPMEQFICMEQTIQATWKSAGDALRIKFQAMPQGVSLICTGFVQVCCKIMRQGSSIISTLA